MDEYEFSFKDIVEKAADVIIVTKANMVDDPGPEIVYVNQAFTELTGYTREEALGNNPRMLQSSDTDENTKRKVRTAIENKQGVRVTIKNYSKSGREYWLDMNIHPLKNSNEDVTHFVAIERDVTKQKNYEHKLEKLSRTDSLTGLLNRRAFNEIAQNEFSRFKRNNDDYSVLMLDIDDFKLINDTYGHATGDLAIKYVAQLCELNRRDYDVLSRFGGEEYCILLPQTSIDDAYSLAEKLRKMIEAKGFTVNCSDEEVKMTVSIGVASATTLDTEYFQVIDRADQQMYKAKNSGKNCTVK